MASTEKKVALQVFSACIMALMLADSCVLAKTLTFPSRPQIRAPRDIVLDHDPFDPAQSQDRFLVDILEDESGGERVKRQASPITMTQGVMKDTPSLLPANSTSAVTIITFLLITT